MLKIDKDSLYYVDEYPIVAIPYQFAGDSMTLDTDGITIVQHISFLKDTLVMKNQWGALVVLYPLKTKWAMVDFIQEAHICNYYALAKFGIHDIVSPIKECWLVEF